MVNDEARKIATRLAEVQGTKTTRWLSETSGIPYTTLRRNIGTPEKFTVDQLIRLALALDLPPGSLLAAPLLAGTA